MTTKKNKWKECTVRQYFYLNESYNEYLIKTLERTYAESVKTREEWSNIMKHKNIIL
jgi:hypothetical protein